MNRPSGAWTASFVAARILSLFVLFDVVLKELAHRAYYLITGFRSTDSSKWELGGLALIAFLAILLWIYAEGMARLITGETPPWATSETIEEEDLDETDASPPPASPPPASPPPASPPPASPPSPRRALVIGFTLLGAYVTIGAIQGLFNSIGGFVSRHQDRLFGRPTGSETADWLYIAGEIIRIVLGVYLVLRASRLAERLRMPGEPKPSEVPLPDPE